MSQTIKKTAVWLGKGLLYAVLAGIALITLFPLVYSFFAALKSNAELMTSINVMPKRLTFENYVYAWSNVNFALYTMNSLLVAFITVALNLFFTTMAGYTLSRRSFRGKKLFVGMFMVSMFLSLGPATMYPTFGVVQSLGLGNSLFGIVITQLLNVTGVFLVQGYLSGISKEFDEAARIDGASFFGIYARIILPMMSPMLAILMILTFRGSWNNYLLPMIITTGRAKIMTLPVAVVSLNSSGGMATMWSVILAATNISIVPMVLIYIFGNKYFVQGLTLGGIKG
jgi:multiple sugar transport system permease protein